MALNRIQKLLFSEYCDFEDMILVESPFAQTTREGHGLRQIHMGLTPTKLVLAVDIIPPAEESDVTRCDVDPEIETFELIAVYPVECVNLSVFRRRKRQSLKAHFCNNRILYFELGGFERRKMFWNLWCERVQFLSPEDGRSSKSETSVATSSSNSTLNLVTSNFQIGDKNVKQLWCKFGLGEDGLINNQNDSRHHCKWIDQHIYEPLNGDKLKRETTDQENIVTVGQNIVTTEKEVHVTESKLLKVNRFANGVQEGCGTGLFLPSVEVIMPRKLDDISGDSTDDYLYTQVDSSAEISKSVIRFWEIPKKNSSNRDRHPRRYALAPESHFLYGLGPLLIHTGDRHTTQAKRSVSAVRIRRPTMQSDFQLPISKRLLTMAISCEAFQLNRGLNIDSCVSKLSIPDNNTLLFWTPEYWHRPQSTRDSYAEFMKFIHHLRENLEKETGQKKRQFLKRQTEYMINILPEITNDSKMETYEQKLRRALKMDMASTAWDFDSTTLAYQLTMIDKALLLKIQSYELYLVAMQGSTNNAPNLSSFIAFSYRISCLICTEILREDSDKVRARLIVRFINSADKCDRISNFQSCRSILSGLQSIPIYRLYGSWAYLRHHHALKYQLFENLCRKYADPRLMSYQKSFYEASQNAPFLPYIGDILARLLGKVPKLSREYITQIACNKNSIVESQESKIEIEIENITNKRKSLKRQNSGKFQIVDSTLQHKIIKFLTSFKKSPTNEEMKKNTVKAIPLQPEEIFKNESVDIEYFDIPDDRRAKHLKKVIEFVNMCQKAAAKYTFNKHDVALDYLLKARYREYQENYYNTSTIEQKIEN